MPASADVIYSNLQDISIPANFDGLYLDVNTGNYNTSMAAPQTGWDINPFYGGKNVQNSPGFQPVRSTTANTSAIVNLAGGDSVGSGSTYSTFTWDHDNNAGTAQIPGYGSSQMLTGSGGNFTDGQEGYIGFKLYTDATFTTANYGSMRVVLTNNTSGAMIKDWAYDNTGSAIKTGWINTDIVSPTAQTVTLNPGIGEAFTLGSQLADASGSITNSVLKTGTGTATLNVANTYTGATTISAGTLALGASGSIAASSAIKVGTAGTFDVSAVSGGWSLGSGKSLGGDGAVTGSATFDNGSIFAWNLSVTDPGNTGSATVADTLGLNGNLLDGETAGGSVFKIVLAGSQTFADTFWAANQSWSNVLTSGNSFALQNLFTTFSYENGSGGIAAPTGGSFSLSGSTLNFTAVPEPTTALAGLLLGAGLLRRKRNVGC